MHRSSLVAALVLTLATACATTTHPTRPSALGAVRRASDLLAVVDVPGPLEVETVASVDWEVPLGGMVNLEHAKAKEAGLVDRAEPIQVFFHVVRHPQRGTFLVDTGMERALRDAPEKAAIRGLVTNFMDFSVLRFHVPLADFVAKEPAIAGVFLTHLHLDHVSGMPDVPKGTPIHAGPGEAALSSFDNLVVQGNMNRAFEGQAPIEEWGFAPDADGRFAGLLDVFGDGSLWAISVPGHTPGSTAYLARTTHGPVLMTGDACHTAWGWTHEVEPGEFSADKAASAKSLATLLALVHDHPAIDVRLGHQRLPAKN